MDLLWCYKIATFIWFYKYLRKVAGAGIYLVYFTVEHRDHHVGVGRAEELRPSTVKEPQLLLVPE